MAVYTRRLGSVRSSPGVWAELFRAPSSGTVVIRHVTVVMFGTTAASEAALRMRPLTKAGEVWIWYAKPLQIGSVAFDLRQVLAPGEALEVISFGQGVDCAVTGYVFE